jgi:hypothetical protein
MFIKNQPTIKHLFPTELIAVSGILVDLMLNERELYYRRLTRWGRDAV